MDLFNLGFCLGLISNESRRHDCGIYASRNYSGIFDFIASDIKDLKSENKEKEFNKHKEGG